MIRKNLDDETVTSFGDEWTRFDQSGMSVEEKQKTFKEYFSIFPWDNLPLQAEGFDMGCGSGRWAYFVAERVYKLHCIDPSVALDVAKKNLMQFDNVEFHSGSVECSGLPPASQDFGYSLGVLHHVPDTLDAINSCASLLKPGAPLLLYLYYAFDNRPAWFRLVWRTSDFIRRFIRRLPSKIKNLVTDLIAVSVYWPIARGSNFIEKLGFSVESIPLSYYRKHSFYTMRTDSRDRFGTPLEQRFTRHQITQMMQQAGFVDIRFSSNAPYWCVVGIKE